MMIAGTVILLLGIAAAYLAARKIADQMEKIKERNEMLVELMHRAESSSQAKSQLLASISDEIRIPVNSIISMSDIVKMEELDDATKRSISDMQRMSRSLLKIITNVLDFSAMEAGKMDLAPADYDMLELYNDICSHTRLAVMDTTLQFRHSLGNRVPQVLYGDEARTRQIITNIVNNSIQYTTDGYVDLKIDRTTRDNKDCLLIRVEDTGIGIKEEDLSKLFDPFLRLDERKNGWSSGTGLGLSITKRFVDIMGGEIFCESEPGVGSVFTVILPLVEGDQANVELSGDSILIFASEGTNVLVAGDNPDDLEVALAILARSNIKADVAESGVDAINKVRGKRYDLVFMEHEMREMGGIAAARCIRAFSGAYFKKLPIIAMSAKERTRGKIIEAGFSDYIEKPVEAASLNRILLKWLPSSKMLDLTEASRFTKSA
jgi:signal transduction histidine kinase/CheY-like chemotaxis protein